MPVSWFVGIREALGSQIEVRDIYKSLIYWWLRVGSNHRPQHYEPRAS